MSKKFEGFRCMVKRKQGPQGLKKNLTTNNTDYTNDEKEVFSK